MFRSLIVPAGALHGRVMLHLLHDALVLPFDHAGTFRLAFHRIFDDRLSLQLFGPTRRLMVHRHMRWSLSEQGRRRKKQRDGLRVCSRLG